MSQTTSAYEDDLERLCGAEMNTEDSSTQRDTTVNSDDVTETESDPDLRQTGGSSQQIPGQHDVTQHHDDVTGSQNSAAGNSGCIFHANTSFPDRPGCMHDAAAHASDVSECGVYGASGSILDETTSSKTAAGTTQSTNDSLWNTAGSYTNPVDSGDSESNTALTVQTEQILCMCDECGAALFWKISFKRGISILLEIQTSLCDKCVKPVNWTSQLTKSHVYVNCGQKPHRCIYCGKLFRYKRDLDSHIRTHTGQKPYRCPYCEKMFTAKGNLNTHIRIHTGEKPYTCTYCEKMFAHKSSLDTHIRFHTGQKPYTCTYCEKSFAHKGHFNTHIQIHMGKQTFSCTYCEKKFSRKSNLKRHIQIHTGYNPYVCTYCEKTFSKKEDIDSHIQMHTG